MKERPILFSSPMVNAILQGKKTQTRRIVKNTALQLLLSGHTPELVCAEFCPYGLPGDILWVRESWHDHTESIKGLPDGLGGYIDTPVYDYKANHIDDKWILLKWRPSIHMPRAACRIMLEITNIHVEHLHDITENDAVSEGCASGGDWDTAPTVIFSNLWKKINGPDSWEENPLVWVIEFKKI